MKKVLIQIKSRQLSGGENNEIEITTVGELDKNDNGLKLSYEDRATNGPKKTYTTLDIFGKDRVCLNHEGDIQSNLIIQKGIRHTSIYSVGGYSMTMGTFGEVVDVNLNENGGSVSMRYTLDIDSNYTGTNEIDINVQEIKQ